MLTDLACRSASPREREYKLFDQHGLYLLVRPSGHKSWFHKYRFEGRERKLGYGPYPEVKLSQARDRMFDARSELRSGRDPAAEPTTAIEPTFEQVTKRWLSLQSEGWKPKHAKTVTDRLEGDILPALGSMRLSEIRPQDILACLAPVQDRGAIEVAHRLRGYCSAVFQMAIATGEADADPAAPLVKALKPKISRQMPALLELPRARTFLRSFEAAPGQPAIAMASRLLALTAMRPGTIRLAQREEFEGLDTPEPIWRIPAEKMKLDRAASEQQSYDFIVPLATQTVELVRAAIEFSGRRAYLFPATRYPHRPFSINGLNVAYRQLPGYEGRHVPHGWRSTFSTIMNERAADLDRPGDRAIIDLMLAHKPPGVEGIYNRAAYMRRRREIAQEWADLLLEGAPPAASLIEGPRKRQPPR